MTIKSIDVVQEQVTAAEVTLYTAPTASNFESASIIYGNCSNEGAVDTELTLNIVKSGGSAAVTNRYFLPKVIFAGQYDPLTPIVGATLKAGDFIVSIGSLASNLNLKISIKETYTDT
jgi:hypothetical protein